MSGSDPLDITGKVARALAKSSISKDLKMFIVPGVDITEEARKKLADDLKGHAVSFEILQNVSNMAELMLRADIAMTGAGLTKYEAAVTGTPGIIIPARDYLVKLAQEFANEGAAINLGLAGTLKDGDIAGAAAKLMNDFNRRRKMSALGKKLVDGRGIERIISEIPKEVLS
jgi:spore coat polysaccharide biosynthesis predicted glycosyltransferase SpsG